MCLVVMPCEMGGLLGILFYSVDLLVTLCEKKQIEFDHWQSHYLLICPFGERVDPFYLEELGHCVWVVSALASPSLETAYLLVVDDVPPLPFLSGLLA